jgi:signal transduction histidine kinase
VVNERLKQDIAKRRQAEADLRNQKEMTDLILAITPNSVLVLDRDLRIVLANRTFGDTFSMETRRLEGRRWQEIDQLADLCRLASGMLSGKESERELESRCWIKDSERIFVASLTLMQVFEVLVVIRDVTDERQRRERLYLTDRLASIGEMAPGTAHELNNPLTGVVGFSKLLLGRELPDDNKEDVESIHDEAERAARVVSNLLESARKHGVAREAIQTKRIVDSVLQLWGYEHRVNDIQVTRKLDPELPEIAGDYYQIQQVFLNIVLNAESAMIAAHGHGELTVSSERVGDVIRISFRDDGPGMASENLGRIFDPFLTAKEVGEGTGLRLSISYGIVSSHGGRIYARSEVGRGASFIVALPVTAA